MKIAHTVTGLAFHLNPAEAALMASTLAAAASFYRTPLDQMPDNLRDYWKGRISHEKAPGPELLEAQDLLQHSREMIRPERLLLTERFFNSLQNEKGGLLPVWEVQQQDLDPLLQIFNDRRMALAIEHEVDQALMDTPIEKIRNAGKQRALWEVHFLAFLQESILDFLQGDWRSSLPEALE